VPVPARRPGDPQETRNNTRSETTGQLRGIALGRELRFEVDFGPEVTVKTLRWQAGSWLGFVILGCAFWPELYFFWPILVRGLALWGFGIGLAYLIALACSAHRRECVLGFLCVALVLYLALATSIGPRLGVYRKFLWNQSRYEEAIARIERGNPAERLLLESGVTVDGGAPLRVAFSWGGVLDNGMAIVYDPTGLVARAQEFRADLSNWGDPELGPVRDLFGGDLCHAWHLWGPWYFCSFT
jgi:hypothetical protein